jgi:hypothetical protein
MDGAPVMYTIASGALASLLAPISFNKSSEFFPAALGSIKFAIKVSDKVWDKDPLDL